ncbi:hypothetical protein [Lentilactobacillus kosonis]|uniref:Anthranilate synthase, aminase component n=1 Tax=Lentilactobacillus kosonis TaxID=2810561 RepID=A0A401FJF4_9LACO|nr:hypothetical protein [Lentilactobacillus kosonis]GAY72489.1 anthranilate synthase, aminase component [Lentilactobacillus kosonis]
MNIDQLLPLKNNFALLPITISFKLTEFDPLNIMRSFETPGKPSFVMTGKPKENEDGYTFVCLNPEASYTYQNGQLTIDNFDGCPQIRTDDLHQFIDDLVDQNRAPSIAELPPFTGGLVGYFSYDYSRYATTAKIKSVADPHQLADADLMLVKTVISYNHATNQVTLSKLVKATEVEALFKQTITELTNIKHRILNLVTHESIAKPQLTPLKYQFSLPEFSERVSNAKQHIIDGDIFQLILSNPQTATISGSLLGITNQFSNKIHHPINFIFIIMISNQWALRPKL